MEPQFLKTPGISPELLKTTIILILGAALIMWSMSCSSIPIIGPIYDSVIGMFDSTAGAADQLQDTLHTAEHLLLLIPAYMAGEVRRPLWSKFKNRNNKRKKD